MTVVCPSCATRFKNPPAEVMKTRPMQCSKCEHEWFIDSQAETTAIDTINNIKEPLIEQAIKGENASDRTHLSNPEASPEPNQEASSESHLERNMPLDLMPQGAQRLRIQMDAPALQPTLDALYNEDDGILTKHDLVVKKFEADHYALPNKTPIYVDAALKPAHAPSRLPRFALTGLAGLTALALGVVFQGPIMKTFPQSKKIYQTAGFAPKNKTLNIANVVTTKSNEDGISRLIVKGEIENIAENTVPVPPIQLIMRGQSNTKLYAWTVSAGKQSLKAGEKSSFTAVAHDFPNDAVNVEVEFAPVQ